MRIIKRFTVILLSCLLLSGCAEVISFAAGFGAGYATAWYVYDGNGNNKKMASRPQSAMPPQQMAMPNPQMGASSFGAPPGGMMPPSQYAPPPMGSMMPPPTMMGSGLPPMPYGNMPPSAMSPYAGGDPYSRDLMMAPPPPAFGAPIQPPRVYQPSSAPMMPPAMTQPAMMQQGFMAPPNGPPPYPHFAQGGYPAPQPGYSYR